MQLNENLQICLLALASRYSVHTVSINEAILGPQSLGAEGWLAQDLIELLQSTNPDLLHAQARLVLDEQESSVYLVNQPKKIPALFIHCTGNIPACRGNRLARRQRQGRATLAMS